ncbi:Poly (ADP-ribose) polymerase [Desmophyllum pertusum]|uniref:Poly (ADP-ribose) polymerase n=1 Tax=Desmophyllum pertusum TaxID=174260 RepID=A0A9W9ZWW8_9CNID|nr:Poly (ADP-ribose) polymerase [Desmophyllum pertusum]
MKKQVTSPEIVDEEFPLVDYEEMSWKSAVTELPQIEAVDSSECTWINSTQVRVCVGDLTKEEVDAVLIMNQDRLDLKKGGQLNKHIALTAGPSVQKECKRIIKENGAQLPGNAVLTDAGNLGCKNLLHIIAYPGKPQILDLQLGVKTGLQLADERGLGSVALPAIGAGQMGLSLADSARVLSGGILSFLERPPQNLRKIRIVLYDESLLSTFAQDVKNEFAPIKTLEEYSALSTARLDDDCLPEEPPWDDALSERSSKAPSATTAEFRVYGKDKKSVTNTVNSLRGVFARHCTLQRVTHKLVPRLLQNCWAWLCDVASKQETDLKKETHNSTIIVGGNSDDVAMVVGCIWQKINRLAENQSEVEKRRLLAQYVRWHYVILDREIAFSEKLSSTIEEACNQRCQEVTLLMNNLNYKVDFNSMTVMSCCSKYPPLRLSRKLLNETGR